MTKFGAGPSSHTVMTGFFTPNSSDLQAGHTNGFGSTMNLLSLDACGGWEESAAST